MRPRWCIPFNILGGNNYRKRNQRTDKSRKESHPLPGKEQVCQLFGEGGLHRLSVVGRPLLYAAKGILLPFPVQVFPQCRAAQRSRFGSSPDRCGVQAVSRLRQAVPQEPPEILQRQMQCRSKKTKEKIYIRRKSIESISASKGSRPGDPGCQGSWDAGQPVRHGPVPLP